MKRAMFVTAGTVGTGLATAQRFAKEGYDIFITSRSEDRAEEAARSIAEQYMRDMGTIEWYVDQTLYRDCHCGASMCYGAFYPGTLHRGIPYNHKGSGLESMEYMLTEASVKIRMAQSVSTRLSPAFCFSLRNSFFIINHAPIPNQSFRLLRGIF